MTCIIKIEYNFMLSVFYIEVFEPIAHKWNQFLQLLKMCIHQAPRSFHLSKVFVSLKKKWDISV